MRSALVALGLVWLAYSLTTAIAGARTQAPLPAGLVIDHTSVELFDRIPPSYLAAARALRVLHRVASVGDNVSNGLNCLMDNKPHSCRTGFSQQARSIPIVRRPQYDRSNWLFEFRGNPGWYGKVADFVEEATSRGGAFDVVSWEQSYSEDPTIDQFWNRERRDRRPGVADVEAIEKRVPARIVYMTAAIAKVPLPHIAKYNDAMRAYTANRRLLFDLAAIESHRPDGSACATDGLPTICADYNSEKNGGHLTNGMAAQRVAKAFWVLMAQIAGWRPSR